VWRFFGDNLKPEWGPLPREFDRLQEIETEQEGKHFVLRTPATGDVGRVFKAVGIALPQKAHSSRSPRAGLFNAVD